MADYVAGDDTPGAKCSNTPYRDEFTCPACYHDHQGSGLNGKRLKCENPDCGLWLEFEIEEQPVYVTTISESQDD